MDVFYYWKNFEADYRAGRIGAFKSTAGKVKELAEGYPDYIWAFQSPKGRKSELQLLARLRWIDQRGVPDALAYDANHADSVLFAESASEACIAAVTDWVGRNFPKLRSANFQGASGQEAIRGVALKELSDIAATLARSPLRPAAAVT